MKTLSIKERLIYLIPSLVVLPFEYSAAICYLLLMNAYFIYLEYFLRYTPSR